jgi:hypothetical protein
MEEWCPGCRYASPAERRWHPGPHCDTLPSAPTALRWWEILVGRIALAVVTPFLSARPADRSFD